MRRSLVSLLLLSTFSFSAQAAVKSTWQTKSITLKNGMEIYLISDPEAVQSAISVDVGVGAFSDPKDHQGIAHFTEHLLFLGTEKYPESESYNEFLDQNGGLHNAFTGGETTNYFLSVNNEVFEEAIDRISEFFISPLFTSDLVERERNQINSEHQKNIFVQGWRTNQLGKSLGKPNHPASQFSTGDLNTLAHTSRKDVVAFYDTYYSANLMKVAIYSDVKVEDLEKWAIKYLSPVKNKKIKRPQFSTEVYKKGFLPAYVETKPYGEKDEKILQISFELPVVTQHMWQGKVVEIIGGLLGTEVEGSITSDLKRKGLAVSLSGGGGGDSFSTSLNISVELTDKGLDEKDLVLERIFAHLGKLSSEGFKKYLFNNTQKKMQVDYDYFEVTSASGLVTNYSQTMRLHKAEDIDKNTMLLSEYRPEEFKYIADMLVPDNALIILTHQGAVTNRTEPYYGSEYSVRPLSKDEIKRLTTARSTAAAGYPVANKYLEGPDPQILKGEVETELAVQLQNDKRGSVWYLRDTKEAQVNANLYIELVTGQGGTNPQQAMIGEYFAEVLTAELNEWMYQLHESGLDLNIGYNNYGLTVTLKGTAQWSDQVIREFYQRLRDLSVNENIFALVKEKMENKYFEADFENPYEFGLDYYFSPSRVSLSPSYEERLPFVTKITAKDMENFRDQFIKQVYVRSLIHGNLKSEKTMKAVLSVYDQWGASALEGGKDIRNKVIRPEAGKPRAIVARSKTGNHAFVRFVELGPREPKAEAISRILGIYWSSDFYNQMRTLQKLGYIVFMGSSFRGSSLASYYIIQSPTNSASDMRERVNKWQKGKLEELSQLTDEEFQTLKGSLTAEVERGDLNFAAKNGRITSELFNLDSQPNYQAGLKKAINSLTREQFVSFVQTAYAKKSISQVSVYVDAKDSPETKALINCEVLFN